MTSWNCSILETSHLSYIIPIIKPIDDMPCQIPEVLPCRRCFRLAEMTPLSFKWPPPQQCSCGPVAKSRHSWMELGAGGGHNQWPHQARITVEKAVCKPGTSLKTKDHRSLITHLPSSFHLSLTWLGLLKDLLNWSTCISMSHFQNAHA